MVVTSVRATLAIVVTVKSVMILTNARQELTLAKNRRPVPTLWVHLLAHATGDTANIYAVGLRTVTARVRRRNSHTAMKRMDGVGTPTAMRMLKKVHSMTSV